MTTRRELLGTIAALPLIASTKTEKHPVSMNAELRYDGEADGWKCFTATAVIVHFSDGSHERFDTESLKTERYKSLRYFLDFGQFKKAVFKP